ncbi:MAG: response regulator [Gammaproteobacteria bacterium]|nr:response regulator [Gammaproteobacteria bacterium]
MELDLTLPAFTPLATALLIDDDEDIVYLLRMLLLRDGFIVHTATNGRDAQEFIATSKPTDIVITDLMLPYASGFELITQIREDRKWKDVPVIVLSGKVTERDAVRALDIGANDYVTKPYNPQELSARIRRLLNPKRSA